MKIFLIVFVLIGSSTLTSCSSLLYYPAHEHLVESKDLPYQIEDVWMISEDKTKLHGWYFYSNVTPDPRAVLVFFHGNAENLSTHFQSLIWILKHEYDFFIFDYRGYGLSEGKPDPSGTLMDGKTAIRQIFSRNPKLPLVVYGQSLGGAIALRSVIDLKNEIPIRLVIADSTFHSYKAIGKKVLSRGFLTWVFQPLAYLLLSDSSAPGEKIGDISPIPLIVIHGQKDSIVEHEFGQKIFDLGKNPKEFWSIPNGRHTDSFWRHHGVYQKKLLEALERVVPSEGK